MEVGLLVVEPNMKSIMAPVLDPAILMSMGVLLRGQAERKTKNRIAARAVAPNLEAGDLKPGAVLEFTRVVYMERYTRHVAIVFICVYLDVRVHQGG